MGRNKAAHDGYGSVESAKLLVEFAYKLGVRFMQTYGERNYEPKGFMTPEDRSKDQDFEATIRQQEEIIRELND
ncbi:hypothetical protein ACJDU8_09185 [Clostridium sp. WILCCON 0269]|uniref:HEPN domain-containing protein n=1 Tax=Candidatus Clostridium eludens TaxID=3381663 RepID=A0ABW8SIY0_9CLOT